MDVPNNGSMSVWIGYNPFIFARLVRNFHVKQNSEGNEILGWIDPLTYRIDKVTFAPKIESGEVERSLVRQSLPLLNVA